MCSAPFLANEYGMVWHGYGMEWKNSKVFVRAWKMLCQFDFRSFHLLTFWPLPLNNYYLLSTFSLTVNLIIIVQMLTMDALLFRWLFLYLLDGKPEYRIASNCFIQHISISQKSIQCFKPIWFGLKVLLTLILSSE